MRRFFYTILIVLAFHISVNAQNDGISNCWVNPMPFAYTQTDGSKVTVKMIGTRLLHYIETLDGYTLMHNSGNALEYAKTSLDGDLIPSGILAHESGTRTSDELSYIGSVNKHLRYSTEKANSMLGITSSMNKQDPTKPVIPSNPYLFSQRFPQKGKRKVLVLLIQFKDQDSTFSKGNFNNMMNQHGYNNTNSFADYYRANSFDSLNLSCDVFGWYTSKNDFATYGHVNGDGTASLLVGEAVDAALAAGVDFSKYDNDGDGLVDGFIVVHSGVGAETSGNYNNIWSNASDLSYYNAARTYTSAKGVVTTISHYTVQAEEQASNTINGIGVFCHEFGHLLGLPDLYNTKLNANNAYESAGVGDYDVMGGGSYLNSANTPASFCAWVKTYFKWVTPVNISAAGAYSLKPSANSKAIYKIRTSVSNEYFLLENRYPVGFDSSLPAHGLAIWHIDSYIMDPTNVVWNTYNQVESDLTDPGVYLEQADGKGDLDVATGGNRGDAGDLFPGSTSNTVFNDKTTPNSITWTGKKTGINIQKITENADSTVSFNFGTFPSTSFVTTSSGLLCTNKALALSNTSTFATSFLWNFGDGSTDTGFAPTHLYTKAGKYTITLLCKSSTGKDSTSSQVTVNASPGSAFTVSNINGGTVTFENTTAYSSGNYFVQIWGDGGNGFKETKSYSHLYQDTGTFITELTTSNFNTQCYDTAQASIHIATLVGIAGQYENKYMLAAYPNPFVTNTSFSLTLEKAASLEIALYNMNGQKIRTIKKGEFNSGLNNFSETTLADLNPGIYFIGVISEGQAPSYMKIIKQ